MLILNSVYNLEEFFTRLSNCPTPMLMLDYDGVLAPLVADRNATIPYPEVVPLLEKLMTNNRTRLVIISGRKIESLINFISIVPMPEIWGCHGYEKLSPKTGYSTLEMPPNAVEGLNIAESMTRKLVINEQIERKYATIVVQWRGLPEEQRQWIESAILPVWQVLAERYPLEILNFRGGLEIRPKGRNKGDVVKSLLSEMPENSCAAYCGDDRTDEDAFLALKGQGLRILADNHFISEEADIQLENKEDLLAFLVRWQEATAIAE